MSGLVPVPKKALNAKPAFPFEARLRGKILYGIVTRVGNRYFAFQNLCKHLPVTLDAGDGNVSSEDHQHLQCHMHGAMYELESGECIAGPCVGARLNRLKTREDGSRILVELPAVIEDV